MAVVDSVVQGRFIYEAATAAIDEHRAFFHFIKLFVPEKIARRFIERHVEGNNITRAHELIEIDGFDIPFQHDFFFYKRVIGLHGTAKGLHAGRYCASGTAKANEADQMAADTVQLPFHAAKLPTAVPADIILVFRNLTNQGQNHGTRVVRNIVRAVIGIAQDFNAPLCRSLYVYIIKTRTQNHNQLQLIQFFEE